MLLTWGCSDNGDPAPSAQGGVANGGSTTAGATTAGQQANGGSSSSSGTAGASGGTKTAENGGNSGSGGTSAERRIVASRADMCKPACSLGNRFCALFDAGCDGTSLCLLEAQCHDYVGCTSGNGTALTACAGPTDNQLVCGDDPTDTCNAGVGCAGFCVCNQSVPCKDGFVFDSNPAVCGCVAKPPAPMDCLDVQCPDGFQCETVLGDAACVKPARQ